MEIKNLSKENLIELGKLRLINMNQDFTEITIEEEYFNGISFIVKSNKWADYRFPISFEMFYPNEFMFLLKLGVKF